MLKWVEMASFPLLNNLPENLSNVGKRCVNKKQPLVFVPIEMVPSIPRVLKLPVDINYRLHSGNDTHPREEKR
jgi:hypothetical protein